MKKNVYFAMDYYDRQTIARIVDKYNLDPMEATKKFILSKTHALLEDFDNGLLNLPDDAVFDMWEVEQITGDPRKSAYIRGE
jgi:hypothetical protein